MNANMNLMEIQETISSLQQALLTAHPEMPILLRKIHTKLKEDPEQVTLLEEDEIAQIINGLKTHANISLTTAKPAKEKKVTATSRLNAILGSSAKISADDF